MKQIGFIVGTGRCGTTILGQVLNSHSKICVPHELQIIVSIDNGDRLYDKYVKGELKSFGPDDFIRLIDSCCPYYFERYFDYVAHFRSLSYPQTDVRQILVDLFDHICFSYRKEIFLEQTPWYGQRLDILRNLFPEMKIIHVVRDGRDVAISFSKTPWWSKDIGENLLRWKDEVNVIHDFVKKNPVNFLEIRYEDLVSNPVTVLGKVLSLFGVQFEKELLDPKKLIDYASMFRGKFEEYQSSENKKWDRDRNTVFFTGSIGAWKRQKGYNFDGLPMEVRQTLKAFNYET